MSHSTNAVDFKAFLETVIARRTDPEPRRPLWVVLDGHRAHWTEREGVRDRLTCEDINVMYLPRACSWYNRFVKSHNTRTSVSPFPVCSAEWTNSTIKQWVKKAYALACDDIKTEAQYEAFLLTRLEELKDRLWEQKQLYAILPELNKVLNEPD